RVGTNGIATVDTTDFFSFDSASIVSESVGSFGAWVQWKTTVPSTGISGPVEFANTGFDDEISINPQPSQEFACRLRKDGTTFLDLVTTTVNAAMDTWYFALCRYNIAADDRRIEIYDTNL